MPDVGPERGLPFCEDCGDEYWTDDGSLYCPTCDQRAADRRKDLGKIAYDAYGEARGWTVVGGGTMPSWDNQSPELREAWTAAADAVVVALTALPLDDASLSTVAALDAAVVAHAERQREARRTETGLST